MLLQYPLYGTALILEHSLQQMFCIHLFCMLCSGFQYAQSHQSCCLAIQFHGVFVGHHLHLSFAHHLLQMTFQRKQVGLYPVHHACSITDILSQHAKQQMFG